MKVQDDSLRYRFHQPVFETWNFTCLRSKGLLQSQDLANHDLGKSSNYDLTTVINKPDAWRIEVCEALFYDARVMLVIDFSEFVEMFVRLSTDFGVNFGAWRHNCQPAQCNPSFKLLSAYPSNRIHSFRLTISLAHKPETLAYASGFACVVTPLAGYNRFSEHSHSDHLCDWGHWS